MNTAVVFSGVVEKSTEILAVRAFRTVGTLLLVGLRVGAHNRAMSGAAVACGHLDGAT